MRDDRRVNLPPIGVPGPGADASGGYSYGAVILPGDDAVRDDAIAQLRGIRFSGWIAPAREGWIVVVGDPGAGVVASRRRGVVEVGAALAERAGTAVLALRVHTDRQLALVAWRAGEEVARYSSDPSMGLDDDEVLSEPVGAEHSETFAALWDRDEAAEELGELLADELDTDSTYESERLKAVLQLLRLPTWVVSAGELPRPVPTGPPKREFLRLRVGRAGFAGRARNLFVRRLRRRWSPPPIIDDPPRAGGGGLESWMF